MSLRIVIDAIGGKPPTEPLTFLCDRKLTIVGWAVDATSGSPPALRARIDDTIEVESARQQRTDVARHFNNPALEMAGFEFDLGSTLAAGTHRIALGVRSHSTFTPALYFNLTVVDSGAEPARPWPRIVIAAAPKSGSTYAHSVLSRYFDTPVPPIGGIVWHWEQNLDGWLTDRIRDHPFILQMHLRAYRQNLGVIESLGISPVVTWRNLADMIISADDHHRREPGAMFLLMMGEPTEFAMMPEQDRYQMLIRYMVPWYVNFYVSWRKVRPPIFMHYEWLAVDPLGYFTHIIERVAGSVDADRLRSLLGENLAYSDSRRNAAVNGRADAKMSDRTKALLEDMLRAPFFEDISELVRELPWNEGASAVLPQSSGSL